MLRQSAPRSLRTSAARAVSRRVSARQYTASNTSPPTPIEKIILDSIKSTGPISYATYMSMCLSHPTLGYYMNRDNQIFGRSGDFITSPEISQVFGELVCIWLMQHWMLSKNSKKIRLIELGPGKGTLLADMLRTMSQLKAPSQKPDDSPKAKLSAVHLVETSETLRSIQKSTLSSCNDSVPQCSFSWHSSLEEIGEPAADEYTMLVAHEFFDALPINVLQKTHTGWEEVLVTATPDTSIPRLRPGLAPGHRPPSAAALALVNSSPRYGTLPVGTRAEVSPTAFKIAHQISEIIRARPTGAVGCALIVDYGAERVFGDSFRAFKEHKLVDPFDRPGGCDLTANVDFASIKAAVGPQVYSHGPISQGTFLSRMGLSQRVETLTRAAPSKERHSAVENAAKRLVDMSGMGREYMAMGLTGNKGHIWPFDLQD